MDAGGTGRDTYNERGSGRLSQFEIYLKLEMSINCTDRKKMLKCTCLLN